MGVIAVNPRLVEFPLVSVIILTGGRRRTARGVDFVLVETAVASVVEQSSYPNYEIVVVLDRTSTDELAERLLDIGGGRVRIVRDSEPFSFSGANNLGVSHAFGDHLIFLNDDTEVITPDWIERFVLWMSIDGVGAVGCCLEYPDGRIQHGGVYSRRGEPSHRYAGFAPRLLAPSVYSEPPPTALPSRVLVSACFGRSSKRWAGSARSSP